MGKKYFIILLMCMGSLVFGSTHGTKKIAYIVSDKRIPFWNIMAKRIENKGKTLGFSVDIQSANIESKKELELAVKAIDAKVDGIILSPTNSSASVMILKLAKQAKIPVVLADIGTDGGEYLSYISSNNQQGAYKIGKILAAKMIELGYHTGKVGIIAIPQKRANGKARTAGFVQALGEARIKGVPLKQQVTFSYEETYRFTEELINQNKDLRAIWLQGSDRYKAALDAIAKKGKSGKILLVCFDAEPIFLDLIPKGIITAAAMQQPYLMGQESINVLDKHFRGVRSEKNIQLPVIAVSSQNIKKLLPTIKRNVLGLE